MTDLHFIIEKPHFDVEAAQATFTYRLGEWRFTERLHFPKGFAPERAEQAAFVRILGLTAFTLGVSYFKLKAPFFIDAPDLNLTIAEQALVLDIYENGLAEFYARNNLKRFDKLTISSGSNVGKADTIPLTNRVLLPIGGGKDSLVSVQLLDKAGIEFTPFAVNPKGPILTSFDKIGIAPLAVKRTLDIEMIRLGSAPGYYNGHVPMTAINSMVAALTALLFDHNTIALSNERSASQGNVEFDGREANHQHSKSLSFEKAIAGVLADASGGALHYFSLLRPFSEVKIARMFARESKFDKVFSSCNENFKLAGHDGKLWCGHCPKCHFTFLILAPVMERERLLGIFGQNLLDNPGNEHAYRELCGLAGQKPWECVGEILEAAACLWALAKLPAWQDDVIIASLKADLLTQYGETVLEEAMGEFLKDEDHALIPASIATKVAPYAV